ncbi:beta-propeller domain-containing protein [Anaerobacillus sp. CMMVII]|nr:beta-propeller domain-containing protein [Anaerobacillus sp. CMMVII]MCT8138392.1 beta-propeller domain-containing protein [Anaerobacillus sp. CMMVII]
MKRYLLAVLVLITFFIIGRTVSNDQSVTKPLGTELPKVGSVENFEQILNEINKKQIAFTNQMQPTMEFTREARSGITKEALDSGADYSSTNVQVAGVDEADRIKNDGAYIYQLIDNQLVISKVNPVSEMKVVYSERFNHNEFYPQEMYVDQEQLVLIGGRPSYDTKGNFYKEFTAVKIYHLNDRSNLELVRELEIEGYYSSSRKIASALYVVTNKHLPYYLLREVRGKSETQTLLEEMKPVYRDSAVSDDAQKIDWDQMYYFPSSTESNYLIVSGLDLSEPKTPVTVNSYLGAGESIYASHEHLYVTRPDYQFEESPMGKIATFIARPFTNLDTIIYKFKMDNGNVTFLAEGKVEGAILNQFSMDEHNGHFRITTTKGDMWSESDPSENNIYILDKNLAIVGSITGIAPGERIYSARFMGDRGYIVTFKQVDPLFVLDLKDPKNPTILGELKIPGFSDYLHPYDENHLIGFGKDTIENDMGGAMVRGFKMALFDITDVNNPIEKFVEIIGDSGTHSELLYNHKALLFSKEKNIIGFPVEVYENKGNDRSMYPTFSFQGAYVYGLDLANGFQLKSGLVIMTMEPPIKIGIIKNMYHD